MNMKKNTLLLFLFVATFGFAQKTVSIVTVNGMSQADFLTSTGRVLVVGTSYDFVIDYTGQETTANDVIVKVITAGFADTPNIVMSPITMADGQASLTLTPTDVVPDAILQVRTTTTTDFAASSTENLFFFDFEVAAPLSVDDFNTNELSSFFYNPQTDIITFGGDVISKSYTIYSLTGKAVIDQKATGSINVASLSKGVYILATDAGTNKFVKY